MASTSDVDELAALPALAPRASTAEHAAEVLRLQIAQGRLRPGTRLREEQVSAAFAISRNTVREAFRLLSHERLVDHTLHRGVHVRTVGPDDIRSMYLHPSPGRAAGRGRRDRGRRHAGRHCDGSSTRRAAAAASGDWDALGTADIEFHRVLMSACRSPHLVGDVRAAPRRAAPGLPAAAGRPGPARAVRRPQPAPGRLLDAGDRDGARAELEDYLAAAERHLLAVLA